MKVNDYVVIKKHPRDDFDGSGFGHKIGDIGVVRTVIGERLLVEVLYRESTSGYKPFVSYKEGDLELLKFQPGDIVKIIKGGGGFSPSDVGKNVMVVTPETCVKYNSDHYKGQPRILCKLIDGFTYNTTKYQEDYCDGEHWWAKPEYLEKVCSTKEKEEDEWAILSKPEEDFSCLNDL
jgi:hypothetical protein